MQVVLWLSVTSLFLSPSLQRPPTQHITESGDVRLVGGSRQCAGVVEVKHEEEWRLLDVVTWKLKSSSVVCRLLGCGSVLSTTWREVSKELPTWIVQPPCSGSESSMAECGSMSSYTTRSRMVVTCSESVRLVNGTGLCSGRVEVKSDQAWGPVCEGDFDQQDAKVVCRELGCGAPSVLQAGELYGEAKAPMSTKEFQCEGSESALLDCRTSDSTRNTCSPDKTVGLTCSEADDISLVGGTSRCAGTLEVNHQGAKRPVYHYIWDLKSASVVCRQLDCGSALSTASRSGFEREDAWRVISPCVGSEHSLRECGPMLSDRSSYRLEVNCSESVRLVDGNDFLNPCAGRVEVKSNQSWASVCEGDFDQQDAKVVCRELGCGAPSVLQGALYGDAKAPILTKEFQCEGSESALLDCRISDSTRNTCSPDKPVGLTCADPVRLVGGTSRCTGTLERKHKGELRPVEDENHTNLKVASVVCRQLGCGSAVSTERSEENDYEFRNTWRMYRPTDCDGSESALSDCQEPVGMGTRAILKVTCSGE